MTLFVDAYNVSGVANLLHSLPRVRLTSDGLLPYHNTTFDYTNSHYVNSLLVTFFASPFALLFIIFSIYIVFITLVRYLSPNVEYPATQLYRQPAHNPHFRQQLSLTNNKLGGYRLEKCHNGDSDKRVTGQCLHCRIFWIMVVGGAIFAAIIGTILLLQGMLESDLVMKEINSQSTESKRSIGNFSRRYLPADSHQNKSTGLISRSMNRLFSRFNTYQTMKLYANETTINSSQANVRWFEQQYFFAMLFYASTNILSIAILSIFWLMLIFYSCLKIRAKSLLIYCMFCLLMITFMLSTSLTSGVAMSDFCLKAKPIIADITVNKVPSNNFTMSFVNYYLHCNLNQWNLDQHKKTFLKVLSRVDRAFAYNGLSGFFSNVRNGIEASYDTLHCSEMNRLINQGLSEFCSKPIEAFAYLFFSYTTFYCIFTLILFVITYWI